jgi:hypothetical protein
MASLATDNRTQLEKDIQSNATAIAIFPWIENGQTKDNLVPSEYARLLLNAKNIKEQPGRIQHCEAVCPYNSMFWKSSDARDGDAIAMVPCGWTNYGGIPQYTQCPLCKALVIQSGIDVLEQFELERGREDINVCDGTTGGTSSWNNKTMLIPTISLAKEHIEKAKREVEAKKSLIERAEQLFKGALSPKDMQALRDEIKNYKERIEKKRRRREGDARAVAAEKRQKTTTTTTTTNSNGGRRTRGKKRTKSRKKKRKSKGRKNRKKRTKRRKVYKLKRKSTRKKRVK